MSDTETEMKHYQALAAVSVFPFSSEMANGGKFHATGITKRELLAAMAIQGICASEWARNVHLAEAARMAVQQADFLLAALADEQMRPRGIQGSG